MASVTGPRCVPSSSVSVNLYRTRMVAAVDDPHEALAPQWVRGRGKQRDGMCGGDAVLARPGVVGNRGQIRQMPRRTPKQAHHLDGLLRRHPQSPLALARAECTTHSLFITGLQLLGTERARRPRRERELHRPVRRLPIVVGPLDAHFGGVRSRVDDPQAARLIDVAPPD